MSLSRPRNLGGLLGAGLVVILYFADSILRASGGSGLSPIGLLVLLLPGIVAAWLAGRSESMGNAEKEAALAGLNTGHFASILLVAALITSVANIDWTAYEGQAGAQVASGVREALVPATIVAALASIVVVYAVCVLLGWLGALLYKLTVSR